MNELMNKLSPAQQIPHFCNSKTARIGSNCRLGLLFCYKRRGKLFSAFLLAMLINIPARCSLKPLSLTPGRSSLSFFLSFFFLQLVLEVNGNGLQ